MTVRCRANETQRILSSFRAAFLEGPENDKILNCNFAIRYACYASLLWQCENVQREMPSEAVSSHLLQQPERLPRDQEGSAHSHLISHCDSK